MIDQGCHQQCVPTQSSCLVHVRHGAERILLLEAASWLPAPSSEIDEAHWGKNLPFATRLDRVQGLPNPAECQRATDLFLKTQWLLERGGGIVFATGTPSANTIAESWTMARYLMRDKLEELGLHHFDAWANLSLSARV
jgi:hypothetical protein